MNILLTGANGFIGSHLLKKLIKQNDTKVTITLRTNSNTDRIDATEFSSNLKSYNIDFIPLEDIFKEEKIECVVHLATFYRRSHQVGDIEEMSRSNVSFPIQLLDTAIKYDCPYFINTGTFFEYDYSVLPITETTKNNPLNLYANTKLFFENILEQYVHQGKIKGMTLKLFSPYGEYDHDYKIIPYIIKSALQDKECVLKNPFQKLDFIYVSDIVDSFIKALDQVSLLTQYEKHNVCTGSLYSILDVVSLVEVILTKSIKKVLDCNVPNMEDIFPLSSRSSYSGNTSLYDGLEKTLYYFRG